MQDLYSLHRQLSGFRFLTSLLTLFKMEGAKSPPPPYRFFPVVSTNVAPKTFRLLVLTLLPNWCKISWSYLVPVSEMILSTLRE